MSRQHLAILLLLSLVLMGRCDSGATGLLRPCYIFFEQGTLNIFSEENSDRPLGFLGTQGRSNGRK